MCYHELKKNEGRGMKHHRSSFLSVPERKDILSLMSVLVP